MVTRTIRPIVNGREGEWREVVIRESRVYPQGLEIEMGNMVMSPDTFYGMVQFDADRNKCEWEVKRS